MDFSGKQVLVFGTGISGLAAAGLLQKRHAEVILFDGNEQLDENRVMADFEDTRGIRFYKGDLPEDVRSTLDLAVLSPGIPPDLPPVCEMKDAGIPIWGEVELAWQCGKGTVLAITGTNGKTTTTSLLGEIMKSSCGSVKVVGNIGIPYAGAVEDMTDNTVTVAEISSFQLETIQDFCPKVSAVLNITPDHLNRHHTMENYIASKMRIAENQSRDQVCILNYEDEILREQAKHLSPGIIWFSGSRRLEEGLYLDGDSIMCAYGDTVEKVIGTGELRILGRHNYENVMAAAAMALSCGIPMERIRATLRNFEAVEHRIEYVAEKRGIRFYNDSKGTNPDAAIKGIQAMDRPTCLIGGGYDKDSEYTEWINSFDGKVKLLVLIGQTREKIAAQAEACGFTDYIFADSLQEAVDLCCGKAEPGDAVLLSPACASWGMFPNYEVRGKMFKELVHALKD
ncbi:MAG: UDP-N-acetylmuramoyl-L-alanine--D-glutamate ligase [Lachnospiraceae bacterium]|nr:UDP-N-acetylmuramoyl-L-alanine--D-glutamate ligase [Lachnospiraceae bacterium]